MERCIHYTFDITMNEWFIERKRNNHFYPCVKHVQGWKYSWSRKREEIGLEKRSNGFFFPALLILTSRRRTSLTTKETDHVYTSYDTTKNRSPLSAQAAGGPPSGGGLPGDGLCR